MKKNRWKKLIKINKFISVATEAYTSQVTFSNPNLRTTPSSRV